MLFSRADLSMLYQLGRPLLFQLGHFLNSLQHSSNLFCYSRLIQLSSICYNLCISLDLWRLIEYTLLLDLFFYGVRLELVKLLTDIIRPPLLPPSSRNLHGTQKPLNDKSGLGFRFGESSSEGTSTQSDLAGDKFKKMNFVKASMIHDVCFRFGESSSEGTSTQSDLAGDKFKKMNFVKASMIHDVCELVKYDDHISRQLNHKGKSGIGYTKPENSKPS
ncbi:hypothetical protein F511_35820 [Dorcoceras hygrometricum]|uniref:Uncharacterized protein n=1 Tax=Dorcoceras hygrometricum TaxID=472368 RepID=A0A2Z7CAM0_9LAMI|nr:hypothetical protein F511_35820 [Dorcoceras hygrometricum]